MPLLFVLAAQLAVAQQISEWRSGLTEINEGWATHEGDDLRWAQPNFDDSAWQQVDLEDLGATKPGQRWYRKKIETGPDLSEVQLLISGGSGTYELYINGSRFEGPRIAASFGVGRPAERVYALHDLRGEFVVALRTRVPVFYAAWRLPPFLYVTEGQPTAVEYERQALESQRLYGAILSLTVNMLLLIGGLGSFALFLSQRRNRDYLFLACYLFLVGTSNGLQVSYLAGIIPAGLNFLISDPLSYLYVVMQIEFTFSFAGRRVGRLWRMYELIVLLGSTMAFVTWSGHLPTDRFVLFEAVIGLPAALLLPVLLLIWYRRGYREAGWLIFPSMLPILSNGLIDLGTASIYLGWKRWDFLADPIPLGPVPLQTSDLSALLFLLAIAVIMFLRFTRVRREQARTAAELNAAREIQQRLVPATLPVVPGFTIETAYFPAQEVGGDFYQVLTQPDCSTLIVVGDVSGKGLKAAMTGALAIGAIRTLSTECMRPADFLARLNQQLVRSQESGFVTCICARIGADGEVTIANAGHLAPYRNGVEVAIESGLPLGILSGAEYTESTLWLEPDDALTLLSDGVVEARGPGGELFGFERTRAVSAQSAAQIAAAALGFGQEDDITVLTVRFAASVVQA